MMGRTILGLALCCFHVFAVAEPPSLLEAIQGAVINDPNVQHGWSAFLAARDGRARAAAKPALAGGASSGSGLGRILFGGSAAAEAKGLDHVQRVRLFELYDAAETAAFEATAAYLDTMRWRKLVRLTEVDLARRRAMLEQVRRSILRLEEPPEAPASSFVPAEAELQAAAGGLREAIARFRLMAGVQPPATMEMPDFLAQEMPAAADGLKEMAQLHHPRVLAAVESVHAARNGNGEQLRLARERRDITCGIVGENVAIAFGDLRRLIAQTAYLDHRRQRLEEAHEGYQAQLVAGKRGDGRAFDAVDDLFHVRKARVDMTHSIMEARLRTYAGTGQLLAALSLSAVPLPDRKSLSAGESDSELCCPACLR